MNPLFARNRISDYLDNELSEQEIEQFESALESSEALRKEVAAIKNSIQLLKQTGPAQAPPDFMDNILATIQTTSVEPLRKGKLQTNTFLWPTLIAAAALFTIIVIPDAPVAPPAAHMGGILEITQPKPLDLPVNAPSAYELLENHQPVIQPQTVSEAASVTSPETTTESPTKRTTPSVSFIPETPYVPEWEEKSEPINMPENVDDSYMFRFASADVLFTLQALAHRYSGSLLDENKNKLEPYQLNNDNNFARVHLIVPFDQWMVVDEALRHLDAEFGHQLRIEGDNATLFIVEATYNP